MSECVPLVDGQGREIGNLIRGPKTHEPIRKRYRWKWCFECRKRLPHMLTMAYDKEPTYYDPIIYWKCGGCGDDYTAFPGRF